MTQPLTRSQAMMTTQITRAAALVLGIGAVAMGMTGLSDRSLPAPGSTLPGTPPGMPGATGASTNAQNGRVTQVSFAPVDAVGLSARLAMLDNAPKIPDAKGVVVNTGDQQVAVQVEESEPASGIRDRVRFLGVIRMGDHDAAFVNIDGRQRIVREGTRIGPPADRPQFPELQVERITGDALVVRDGQRRERLDMSSRSGPAVTMADGGVVNRVEATPADARVRGESGDMPQREIERRNRMIERQREGNLNMNPENRRMPPVVTRQVDLRNNMRPQNSQNNNDDN